MSQENVEIVRTGTEAWRVGGVEAVIPYYSETSVSHPVPEFPGPSEYRGHDGIREFMLIWTESFDDLTMEIVELHDAGEQVVSLGWLTGRVKGTDAPIRQPMGEVYSMSDGLITEAWRFLTWEEALEAAGLKE